MWIKNMRAAKISVLSVMSRKVDPQILFDLLDHDFLPIIAPIGLGDEFESYNINADDAACAIAKAVGAEKLAFLTDIEGLVQRHQ